MKKNNINFKLICRIISDIALGLLLISFFSEYFLLDYVKESFILELRYGIIGVYLLVERFYYKAESKEKSEKIADLEHQIRKLKNEKRAN